MKLTPSVLRAAYTFLRATPPFLCRDLPAGEGVQFRVSKGRDRMGTHQYSTHHIISISSARVCHTTTLVVTMAHEMVHLAQAEDGTETKAEHNAAFRRMAKLVCRHHGFDPQEF